MRHSYILVGARMHLSQITIKNFRKFKELTVEFQPGVNALVGPNDSGKTAVIDAIRLALSTRDESYIRLEDEDFRTFQKPDGGTEATKTISIECQFKGLNDSQKAAFLEYLTYNPKEDKDVSLHIHWSAQKRESNTSARRWIQVSVHAGPKGNGPQLDSEARHLLACTYLKPLRDAEREMSPGRRSRLSQILAQSPIIKGDKGEEAELVNIFKEMQEKVQEDGGVKETSEKIQKNLQRALLLEKDDLSIAIGMPLQGDESQQLNQVLERLELSLRDGSSGERFGRSGLGSNNLLFIACEMLLLRQDNEGPRVFLIEEPEAHVHPQRQIRLIDYLLDSGDAGVQVILTTHSPNLASRIPVEKLIMMEGKNAFSLAKGKTMLEKGDYKFLSRFLDVTKANLFFAHGVIIVEGPSEAILLPTIAKAMGYDLAKRGVSIVDIGNTAFARYARIFQRAGESPIELSVPVALVTDRDIKPDCADKVLKAKASEQNDDTTTESAGSKEEAPNEEEDESLTEANQTEVLSTKRAHDGQLERTFITPHWTLEYDLAKAGLEEEVHIAIAFAKREKSTAQTKRGNDEVRAEASKSLKQLEKKPDCERLVWVIRPTRKSGASKSVTAQYLVEDIERHIAESEDYKKMFLGRIPAYLKKAIRYACGKTEQSASSDQGGDDEQ